MTATTTEPKVQSKFSLFEVVILLVICGGGIGLLLPALASSRENARSNICRRNLRRLDLATIQYAEIYQRLPDAVTWPDELLTYLRTQSDGDRLPSKEAAVNFTFQFPRPPVFTCPSQLTHQQSKLADNAAHYELIVDRSKQKSWQETNWKFRDRELAPPPQQGNDWWRVGVELTGDAAAQQLGAAMGPHVDYSFNESNSHGETFQVGRAE
ncbi:MAG: DUF1559 domain-containing protein [Planctomycetales bacterium]|nr:DUF1559 domain-containing protein [Planctomycetales bacterium]